MMGISDYHFVTHWRVAADIEEVNEILSDPLDLPRWWPAVYLEAIKIEAPDASGSSKVISLFTKGWLPYTLRWSFRVTDSNPPHGFALNAWGDFVGRGIWTFRQDGEYVDITYDWRIAAKKPLLRLGSPLLKPIFSANHHWAMRKGEESLRLELARRAALTDADRAAVPPPPGPTPSTLRNWIGFVARG